MAWSSGNNVSSKLKKCAGKLVSWKWEKFGDIHSRIHDLRRSLDTFQCLDPSETYHQQIKFIEGEVDRLLEIDETYWH